MRKSLETIISDYKAGLYFPDNTQYKINRLPDWHIFDEELSVKQNREMLEAHNNNIQAEKERRRRDMAALEAQMRTDVTNYIMDEYQLSEAHARMVEARTFTERHSTMVDYFASIDDDAQWAKDFLSAK